MTSPYFPLDVLKQYMMDLLAEAVQKGAAHIRDPIGGSNENQFAYVITIIPIVRLLSGAETRSRVWGMTEKTFRGPDFRMTFF